MTGESTLPRIVCYGDSNTYGYDGMDPFGGRLPPEARWPELLSGLLGCEVCNCGLNGRRVPRYERSVQADLALLRRQAPCALVVVLLGTNDLLLESEPEEAADCMRRFLPQLRAALPGAKLLLCAPPPVEDCGAYAQAFRDLAEHYRELAAEQELCFVDTTDWGIELSGDGVHFSARGHRLFAVKMAQFLRPLLS